MGLNPEFKAPFLLKSFPKIIDIKGRDKKASAKVFPGKNTFATSKSSSYVQMKVNEMAGRDTKRNRSKWVVFLSLLVVNSLVISMITPAFAENEIQAGSTVSLKSENYAPQEILVKFKKGVSQDSIRALNKEKEVKEEEKISKVGVRRLEISSEDNVSEVVGEYKSDPKVEFAEPNYVVTTEIVPNDSYYNSYQWNMPKINAPAGWDLERGGTSQVVVAVVDTGVDIGHPDLNDKIVAGYDFANDDSDPSDDHGHGTHVAGIIGAETNNGQGVAGVSWGTKIMPVKVLTSSGSGYLSDVVSGIIYAADHGARVVNLSLGSSYYSSSLQSAVSYAYSRGVTVVAAAGNAGNTTMIYPAGCTYAIGVGATDQNDAKASFSTYNSSVDVSAPGVSIASTWYRGEGYYALASGTSMATPHVAGLAALIVSQNPSRTPADVEDLIKSTAVDLGSPGRDNYYGYGRINLYEALSRLNIDHPNGSLIKGSGPAIYLLENGQKRHIPTWEIFVSRFKSSDVVRVSDYELGPYPQGSNVLFREGLLAKSSDSPIVYAISDGQKRAIASAQVFERLGYRWANIWNIPSSQLNMHLTGDVIDNASTHPSGTLIKGSGPDVYYIENGEKKHVPSVEIFESRFKWTQVVETGDSEIDGYAAGSVVLFREGLLVKGSDSPVVYVISDGKKRPIASAQVFEYLGYKWINVWTVPSSQLDLHETGESVFF